MALPFERNPVTIRRMKINLNLKVREDNGPVSMPYAGPEYYPEFTVTQKEDDGEYDLGDLPDTGELTIRYSMSRSSENKKTGICTYTFEVREIVSAADAKEKSPSKNYGADAGSALDKLKEQAEHESEDNAAEEEGE